MDREHNKQKRFWRACVLGPLLALLLSGCGMFRPADNGPAPVKAQKVVHTAYSQMGKQYRLGGASPQKGFDCSGLIWWAYRQNGMSVPRVTVDQARAGQSVPKGLAEPARPAYRHLRRGRLLYPQPAPWRAGTHGEHEHPLLAQQIDFRTPGRSLNRNAMIMTCDT